MLSEFGIFRVLDNEVHVDDAEPGTFKEMLDVENAKKANVRSI